MGLESFRLDGRVALVTGGNRGLGLVMAKALAEAGADVVVVSRQQSQAEEAAAGIAEATGRRALGLGADVTSAEEVEGMVARVSRPSSTWTSSLTTPASTSASRSRTSTRRVGTWSRRPISRARACAHGRSLGT